MPSVNPWVKALVFRVPGHLEANHAPIDPIQMTKLRSSIAANYFRDWRGKDRYSAETYQREADAMLIGRLGRYRTTYIPWIDAARRLEGLKILEVGCGTGASTLALAEQGARVTAIDIDEGALQVAKDRCSAYGVTAELRLLNASAISTLGTADVVIFNACLEHMTVSERLQSLCDGWKALSTRGLLIILETPNRLWWADTHTSKLPMYHCLPDELAYQYSRFSPRENFREIYRDHTNVDSMTHFLRRGRGMSFHETDLAIGPSLNVLSSLDSYLGWKAKLLRLRLDKSIAAAARRMRTDSACKKLLRRIYPKMHSGWHEEYLHLIIQKENESAPPQHDFSF